MTNYTLIIPLKLKTWERPGNFTDFWEVVAKYLRRLNYWKRNFHRLGKMNWFLLPLLLSLYGCGTFQKWAMRSTNPVFVKTSHDLLQEGHWEFFRDSSPGNLKLMELLWQQDHENLELLGVLIKGFSGYAFAIPETLYLEDEIKGIEESRWKKEAIVFYTRSLDYGLYYLHKKGIKREDLLSNNENKLKEKLKGLGEDDYMALLYTAQSWGSLINLQKDNVALVSQVPKVKILFDFVCNKKPDIDQNVCDIFYAQYESSRPKMLGGNPEKGEKLYLEAIKKHPRNLLIRVSYIQYRLIPGFKEEEFQREAVLLSEEFSKWENLNRDALENRSSYKDIPELNLYNSIAQKRFQIMNKLKNKIF